jgi:ABC-type glycerol-3-phosphate transport system substrate-binding protein
MSLNNYESASIINAGSTNGIKYIEGPDEYTTDSVQNAVFDRNKKVTSKLGLNVKYNYGEYMSTATLPIIENIVLSDLDDAPDIIQAPTYAMVRAGIKGLLYNALTKDEANNYFDFTAENGWYTDFMYDNTLDQSKMFMLAGDYFIDVLRYAYAVFVNIDMYEDLFASEGGIEALYETVQAGDWTYDELMRCADAAYIDNGTVGSVDEDDIFGIGAGSSWYYRTFFSTSGLDIFEEKDGKIAYIEDISAVHTFVDKLMEMMSHDSFLNPHNYGTGNYEVTKLFTSGKALFALDQFVLNLE